MGDMAGGGGCGRIDYGDTPTSQTHRLMTGGGRGTAVCVPAYKVMPRSRISIPS